MKAEQRQVPQMQERLALGGDRVTLRVIPQHPRTTPDPVEVTVKAPVRAGPVGTDLAVFDYDRERDRVLPAAMPNRSGAFPMYALEDPRFHQLNAYAIAARAIDLVEYELGRTLAWGFEANRLIVLPHAGYLANAFYEEDTHSLQFYSFRQLDGSIYHTSLVHDIVAHETGHALLDAVRDRYTEGNHRETAAIHEAVGDLAAVFAAFSHEIVREQFLASAGPTLRGPNLVASIAEDFQTSADGTLALRDLARPVDPSVLRETTDPHVLSLQFSGAMWEALIQMYEVNLRKLDPEPAFKLARTALQRMFVRAFDYLPPADGTFAEFATALYRADRFAQPDDEQGYRPIIAKVFADRGLIGSASEIADESDAQNPWPGVPATWPRLTPAEAYLFLDQNRKRLALSTQAAYRDFVVRDLQICSRPPDHAEIDAVVLTYEYPVDVELSVAKFGSLGGHWLPIWGGGTLVFDADGRLRHHAEKPVTRERIRDALRFLESAVETPPVQLDAGLEERVLARSVRAPYVPMLQGDRVTLRSNPAARCGARNPQTGAPA
ncbi:MAG: hypothetical protein WD830_03995 [Chloroflexota bacterium]